MREHVSTINRVKDISNMSDFEKKHVPMIEIAGTPAAGEAFEVNVWVGEQMAHPSEAEHHIEFIDIYLDDMFIARTDLSWGYTDPKACFTLRLGNPGTLRAFSRCNLHGDWTYSIDLSF